MCQVFKQFQGRRAGRNSQWQRGTVVELVSLGIVLVLSIALLVFAITSRGPQEKQAEWTREAEKPLTPAFIRPKIVNPPVIYNLTGVIKEMRGNVWLVAVSVPWVQADGAIVYKKDVRYVILSQATKLSRLKILPSLNGHGQTIEESAVSLADFSLGDKIEVIAGQDITETKEFEASQVRLLSRLN